MQEQKVDPQLLSVFHIIQFMPSPTFPLELQVLIVDTIGEAFVDPTHPDYQGPSLRTSLYALSLSSRALGGYCRRHLWHTLSLTTKIRGKGEHLVAIPGFQKLYETLSSDCSPEPYIRRLNLHWDASVLSNVGKQLIKERIPEAYIESWANNYTTYVPKILHILKRLDSVHWECSDSWCLEERYEHRLFPPTYACIRNNPLRKVDIHTIALPSTFLSLLPVTLEKLAFSNLRFSWDDLGNSDAPSCNQMTSPKELRLVKVHSRWFNTMASLPTSFYANLTTLDVYIVKRGPSDGIRAEHDVFNLVHQQIISRSPSLQDLSIRFRNIEPKVYQEWSSELPLVLADAPLLPSLTGTLTLELDFYDFPASTEPLSFGAFINAYLDYHDLSGDIDTFQLIILCTGEWGNHLAGNVGCGWHEMDARLSDESNFPHLQTVKIRLVDGYIEKGKRIGLWGLDTVEYGKIAREIGERFGETQAGGVEVRVRVVTP